MVKKQVKKLPTKVNANPHETPEKSQSNSQHGTPCGAGMNQGVDGLEQAVQSIDLAKFAKARSEISNDRNMPILGRSRSHSQMEGSEDQFEAAELLDDDCDALQLALSPRIDRKLERRSMMEDGHENVEAQFAEADSVDSSISIDTSKMQDLFMHFLESIKQEKRISKRQRPEEKKMPTKVR